MLRIALRREGRTVMRFLDPTQDLSADAMRRLRRMDVMCIKDSFVVVGGKLGAQPVATPRNGPHSAPVAIAHMKSGGHHLLCGPISLTIQHAGILILDLSSPSLELTNNHQRPLQNVDRLKS